MRKALAIGLSTFLSAGLFGCEFNPEKKFNGDYEKASTALAESYADALGYSILKKQEKTASETGKAIEIANYLYDSEDEEIRAQTEEQLSSLKLNDFLQYQAKTGETFRVLDSEYKLVSKEQGVLDKPYFLVTLRNSQTKEEFIVDLLNEQITIQSLLQN